MWTVVAFQREVDAVRKHGRVATQGELDLLVRKTPDEVLRVHVRGQQRAALQFEAPIAVAVAVERADEAVARRGEQVGRLHTALHHGVLVVLHHRWGRVVRAACRLLVVRLGRSEHVFPQREQLFELGVRRVPLEEHIHLRERARNVPLLLQG